MDPTGQAVKHASEGDYTTAIIIMAVAIIASNLGLVGWLVKRIASGVDDCRKQCQTTATAHDAAVDRQNQLLLKYAESSVRAMSTMSERASSLKEMVARLLDKED